MKPILTRVLITEPPTILTPAQYSKNVINEAFDNIYPQFKTQDRWKYVLNICKNYEQNFFVTQVTGREIKEEDKKLILDLIEISQLENINKTVYLANFYEVINKFLCNHEFGRINFLLSIIPFKWIEPLFIVGFLRVTFPARDRIMCWKNTVIKYKNYLDNNTEWDSDRLLIGLLNEIHN